MKIFSIHYNKPEYIEIQKLSIDKYVKFQHEFIVLDNSIDINIKKEIVNITNSLGIKYYDCDNTSISVGSSSHQHALRYLLNIISDGDSIMIIDHDIFPIDYIDEKYYENCDIVCLNHIKGHVIYPWPGLIILNNIKNKSQMSFDPGNIDGFNCDTGGSMHYYIKNNNLKIKEVAERHMYQNELLMSSMDNLFIHLISGSDWNKDYDLQGKLNLIKEKLNYDKNIK